MGCCVSVEQASVAVIERFGKFQRMAGPGLNLLIPCVEVVGGIESLKIRQLDVRCDTKTKDNVFVTMMVSVQYEIQREEVYTAHYKLTNATQQITAYIFDVVRASVPKITLDDVFEQKDQIALAVKQELGEAMKTFGFTIHQALVTDVDPDQGVKRAMNEINAARRMRDAATDKAEAEKILVVKAAEADAESKHLSGVGIARQRKAIVDGLRDSVSEFSESVEGATPKDVMDLVLITQYFDTLKEIGASSRSSSIFIPTGPSHVGDLKTQFRQGMMEGMMGNAHK